MFIEYKKIFFFQFLFFGPNPGSVKIEHQNKVDAWPTVYLWISKSETKKPNGFLKRKVAYVTIYNIFKKIKKNKKWRAFEKFIKKMAYFPAVFWVNKILYLYLLA